MVTRFYTLLCTHRNKRYPLSKLLEILIVRELAEQTESWKDLVAISVLDPGFCYSEVMRNAPGYFQAIINFQRMLVGKSTEQGSRTLVSAVASGIESHGKYFHNGVVDE